ncbi:unnamed protein product [Auanema sp. JU1783]|nr:unnamed protein product [Auanema sp. JU1783]
MIRFIIVAALLTVSIQSESECVDKSTFCRFITSLCNSTAHQDMLRQSCAKTCDLCELPSLNITENPDDIIIQIAKRALKDKLNCTQNGDVRKCVFNRKNTTATTRSSSTEGTPAPSRARVVVSPPANAALKKFVADKKETKVEIEIENKTQIIIENDQTKIAVVLPTDAELKNTTHEYRKFRLQELMSTADLRLPRITNVRPDSMSVSLSKTLIKGTCFDEYVYCREFEALCIHPQFSDIMAAHCTMTCGRCEDVDQSYDSLETENCEDLTPDCETYKDVCQQDLYVSLTKEYCRKTCGFCKPKCRDRHKSCKQYSDDGFCTDVTYTTDEIRFLCGQTCKLC